MKRLSPGERTTTNLSTLAGAIAAMVLLFALPVTAQVSGTVVDDATDEPLEGAIVSVRASTQRVTADADGEFDLVDADGDDLVVAGALKGYYTSEIVVSSPASDQEIRLSAVPQGDNEDYVLRDPADCDLCHPDQYEQWTGSPMAKAGTNTWVYDIYDGSGTDGGLGGFVYVRDSVHAEENPESECASCHQPEPWIYSPFSALEDIDDLSVGAQHGVSCDVCHKIANIDETKTNYPGIHPEAVTFTRPDSDAEQVQYGVLGDTGYTDDDDAMYPSYQPQLLAAVCAACHQDKNDPDGDGDFEDEDGVLSEPTYQEWLESPYGEDPESEDYRTCVDCHMPAYGAKAACVPLDGEFERDPDTIRSHEIRGTTPEYLENAVTMTFDAEIIGEELHVDVTIENDQTGHHVPTGVTVRNMILVIDAWREEDDHTLVYTGEQLIHDLGGIGDPEEGYYAGLPGKFYSKVNHNEDGVGPTFFTDATGIEFDSRLAALEVDDMDFVFEVPPGGGTINVQARLIYRRAFRFLVDAKNWTEDGHGNPLADVAPPHYGHLMESASTEFVSPYVPPEFRRGDVTSDGLVQLVDVMTLLAYLFIDGDEPVCPDAADANDDERIELLDAIYLVNFVFVEGSPEPPAPGPHECGLDDDPVGPCGDVFCTE